MVNCSMRSHETQTTSSAVTPLSVFGNYLLTDLPFTVHILNT